MPNKSATKTESAPEHLATSEAEQMYLITVARAEEAGAEGPVAVSQIAETLGVSVPSANEMVHKLDDRGLLAYERYRGVLLSEQGRRVADRVLRTRRLWATFLADHLGFSPAAADEQACDLEHATSTEAADRLATFLGNPEAGPLGHPIPPSDASYDPRPPVRLSELPVGAGGEVISSTAADNALEFLVAEGIAAGRHITVVASGSSGLLVEIDGRDVHLSDRLAKSVRVRAGGGDGSTE